MMKETDQYVVNIAKTFFSNINHEIRTPLNAILGFSELLKTTDKKDEFIDVIIDNSRKLLNFTDRLIYLSQLQSGNVKPKLRSVDLHRFLHETFNKTINSHEKIKNGTIQLMLKEPPENDHHTGLLDEEIISCLFDQLINDAVQNMTSGYIKIGYSVKEKKEVTFFVQDSRVKNNIKQEEKGTMPKFFTKEEFYQFYNAGHAMGMSVCIYMLDILKGDLNFASGSDGFTIYFSIPIRKKRKFSVII